MHQSRTASRAALLRTFLLIGSQSFGGGSATLFMIRRAAVETHAWLSDEAFSRDWALVQAAPGINLLAVTILVGRRVAGMTGAFVALFGLMLPSIVITIVMTAFFAEVRGHAVTQAALKGVVPATVGLGLVLSASMARPLLVAARREGRFSFVVGLAIVVGSALAVSLTTAPVVLVLLIGGVVGAVVAWVVRGGTATGGSDA